MRRSGRTARFRTAKAYLEVARSVLDERNRDEYLNVPAGLAVLRGIAASNAIYSSARSTTAAMIIVAPLTAPDCDSRRR